MSNNSTMSRGCAGWFKWLIATLTALLAAGGSIVALINHFNPPASVIEVHVEQPGSPDQEPVSAVAPPPDQPEISPELEREINDFLSGAIQAEISAYWYGDASYATQFYADALQALQLKIAELNRRGILEVASFDYAASYIADVRLTNGNTIEVDSCEYWARDYYDRQTGALIGSDPLMLVPQTITIERLSGRLFVTSIAFYTGQAFCR